MRLKRTPEGDCNLHLWRLGNIVDIAIDESQLENWNNL